MEFEDKDSAAATGEPTPTETVQSLFIKESNSILATRPFGDPQDGLRPYSLNGCAGRLHGPRPPKVREIYGTES
jgi:hypothetical protein